MGSGASTVETRHSRLFKEGHKSLQEGRFTYAALYFEQAIEKHDGHALWSSLDEKVEAERKASKAERKRKNEEEKADDKKSSSHHQQQADDPSKLPEANGEEVPAEANETKTVEIPLDHRLMDVLDYLQLRADVADAYVTAERLEEGYFHTDYIASHTALAIKALRAARENIAGGEGAEGDNPLERRPRLGFLADVDQEREPILICFDEALRLHWISASANAAYITFKKGKTGHGEKRRKKDLDAAVHACLLVEQAIFNYAKDRTESPTNQLILRFLESALDDLECASSTSSAPDDKSTEKGRNSSISDITSKSNNASTNAGNLGTSTTGNAGKSEAEGPSTIIVLQRVDRRSLCRSVPTPSMEPSLRMVYWMGENIRRIIAGRNMHLEMQKESMNEKTKKKLLKRQEANKFLPDKKPDYSDVASLSKSLDEENALLLFPVLLIQADIHLELGAATKGIATLDRVEKMAALLYGAESLEHQCIMQHVTESRKRGGALFMMFDDQMLAI